ncbi:MAG: hypothetical protein PHN52_13300 [candidate division Zixibacteria bacterium]|nr:hypothetical protein [candidate division Zixibacteria bacterium]
MWLCIISRYGFAAMFVIVGAVYGDTLTIDYLGEQPPGDIPVKFAPGVVSTPAMEFRLVVSPTGEDIFFCREGTLKHIRRKPDGSGWEAPITPTFCGDHINGESWFSPDGSRLYFCSRRSMPNAKVALNVWVTEKINGDWGPAKSLGSPVNDQTSHAISVSDNGTLYASGIIRFRSDAGKFLPAEPLTPPIEGYHPCIAPDESFLIFGARSATGYDYDLYIIFQKSDGTWTDRMSLGDKINTEKKEGNASLSPDGKYLFFSRAEDIFWVRAALIDTLRVQALTR